jgi:hypothetical protein
MYTNELLEEIWRIKDDLAREADYDIHKFCDQLREYTEKNPLPGPVLRTPEEVRRFLDFGELPAAPAVREDDPKYGEKKP